MLVLFQIYIWKLIIRTENWFWSFYEGMNGIPNAHIFTVARHTMCMLVIPFIPSWNNKNQLSIPKWIVSKILSNMLKNGGKCSNKCTFHIKFSIKKKWTCRLIIPSFFRAETWNTHIFFWPYLNEEQSVEGWKAEADYNKNYQQKTRTCEPSLIFREAPWNKH